MQNFTEYAKKIHALIDKARELHGRERDATIQSVLLVGELDYWRAPLIAPGGVAEFAKSICLTRDQFMKRAQAARVLRRFPRALAMLKAGETQVSHLAMIAARINEWNCDVLLDGIKGKTRREVEAFANRVTKNGSVLAEEGTVDLRLTLTESQLEVFDRAREVLSAGGKVPSLPELVVKALEDLLERRDPVRKAERSAARAARHGDAQEKGLVPPPEPEARAARHAPPEREEERPAVPAGIRHAVWLRDEGRCTFRYADDTRCSERSMLELDHALVPWCRGGTHELSNLALKRRAHNLAGAESLLGREFMARWTG